MSSEAHFRKFRRKLMEQTRDITREFETQFIDWLDAIVRHKGVALLEDLPPDSDDDIEEPNISDIDNDERFEQGCCWNILAVGETIRADGTRAGRNDDRATRIGWRMNTVRSIIMPDGTIKPHPLTADELKKRKFPRYRNYNIPITKPNPPPEELSDSEMEPEKPKRPPRPTKKRTAPPAKIRKRRPEQDSVNDSDDIEEISSDEWNKESGEPQDDGQDQEINSPGVSNPTSNDNTSKLPTVTDLPKSGEVVSNENPELPPGDNSGTDRVVQPRCGSSSVASEYSGSTSMSSQGSSATCSYSGSSASNTTHPYFRGSVSPIPQSERRRFRKRDNADDSASQSGSFILAGDLTVSSISESFNNELSTSASVESEMSELDPNLNQRKKNQLVATKRRAKQSANLTSETERNTTGSSSLAALGKNSSGDKFLNTNVDPGAISGSSSGISDETGDGSIGNLPQNLRNFDLDGTAFTPYPNVLPSTVNFSTVQEESEDDEDTSTTTTPN